MDRIDTTDSDDFYDAFMGLLTGPPLLALTSQVSPLHVALSAGDVDTHLPNTYPLLAYAQDSLTLNLDSLGRPLRFASAPWPQP